MIKHAGVLDGKLANEAIYLQIDGAPENAVYAELASLEHELASLENLPELIENIVVEPSNAPQP